VDDVAVDDGARSGRRGRRRQETTASWTTAPGAVAVDDVAVDDVAKTLPALAMDPGEATGRRISSPDR
jgi:hypothetical protein